MSAAAACSGARHRRWVLTAWMLLLVVEIVAVTCAGSRGHQAGTLSAHLSLWASPPAKALRALIARAPRW